jgi:hypothetical protein
MVVCQYITKVYAKIRISVHSLNNQQKSWFRINGFKNKENSPKNADRHFLGLFYCKKILTLNNSGVFSEKQPQH